MKPEIHNAHRRGYNRGKTDERRKIAAYVDRWADYWRGEGEGETAERIADLAHKIATGQP